MSLAAADRCGLCLHSRLKCSCLCLQQTIGDCYVAVTGLPNPQERHAIIMAYFAADCMSALNELMPLLVAKLGPDTQNLTMRFGLHSGPVTAGVLKNARARFQLFGTISGNALATSGSFCCRCFSHFSFLFRTCRRYCQHSRSYGEYWAKGPDSSESGHG